jgi:hypothetical protein
MGASSWSYYTPYQPDIDRALQDLQESVFRSGGYHQREPFWREMSFEEYLPPDPGFTDADRAEYLASFQHLQSLQEPTSIETLLEWNGEEATHSILDIDRISLDAQIGAAAPLSDGQLETLFGTSQPTRKIIEQAGAINLDSYLQKKAGRYRGQATYILVYRDGLPVEVLFTGYSGD